jgi:hypothetical protein
VHTEHVIGPGRDDIDVLVFAGASYGVAGPVRLGVESFAQDLEELSSDGAEGGARWMAGPTIALETKMLWVGGSTSLGFSQGVPESVARLAVAYRF